MKPEAQRIAIAEACGWCGPYSEGEWLLDYGREGGDVYGKCVGTQPDGYRDQVPDYLSDLNAMHEAEKVLVTEKQCSYFAVRLAELVKGFNYDPFTGVSGYIWHATAAQRAEAFLRTIGKWEDDPVTPPVS